ncbi:DMT family transporter [Arenimonas sp.]|uniref:DMT family transporter n=1 Tax=Arenimonas sp. TaxID=1872635 RepID=UPI0039E62326
MPARDFFLVFLICLAWAGNFLTSKLALQEFPPLLFTALRLMLLAALLAAFLRPPPKGQWPRLIAVAMCNAVLHFGLSFWSLKLSSTLASPAILMQSYVPMASLLAWWLLGERFHWRTGMAIALSFAGVLVLGFDPSVLQNPAALGLMLVSAFFIALGSVLMRDLRGFDLVNQQGWTSVIGIAPLLLWSAAGEHDLLASIRQASWVAWLGVGYAAIIASLVGHGLYFRLVQRHPVAQVTPYLLIAPLIATVLGIVFLHDRVGPRLWLGGAMVLGGVLVIGLRNLAKARPAAPVEP